MQVFGKSAKIHQSPPRSAKTANCGFSQNPQLLAPKSPLGVWVRWLGSQSWPPFPCSKLFLFCLVLLNYMRSGFFSWCTVPYSCILTSVADPGCLSRTPDPEFYPSRILDPGSQFQDPKTATKEKGKKIFYHISFGSYKFHKIENYLIFEMPKKKILASFQKIIEFLAKNLSLTSKTYGFGIRDPRPGIWKKNLFWIPDPGSRGQKGTGSRIRIRNTDSDTMQQFWDR